VSTPGSEPSDESPPSSEPPQNAYRRSEILTLLAGFGARRPEQVPEAIDSMELAWLIHQLEQRYNTRLDLDDGELSRMSTVSGAAVVLDELSLG
jgi:hypothetical protein